MEVNDIPHTRANAVLFFKEYIETQKHLLVGKRVYDLSAGSGYIANLFYGAGCQVKAFDLFPEHFVFTQLPALKIDLQQNFEIGDGEADIVILSETFEHLPNQFHFFKEASRIMSEGSILIITTPNPSSLRSRFSQFVTESEHYSNPLPDELSAFVTWPETNDGYFNKIFISGILRIRTLAAINKLKIKKIYKSPYSTTSLILMIFYPLIWFFSWKNMKKQIKASPQNKDIYKSIFKINTSVNILLSKHLAVEFVKS